MSRSASEAFQAVAQLAGEISHMANQTAVRVGSRADKLVVQATELVQDLKRQAGELVDETAVHLDIGRAMAEANLSPLERVYIQRSTGAGYDIDLYGELTRLSPTALENLQAEAKTKFQMAWGKISTESCPVK